MALAAQMFVMRRLYRLFALLMFFFRAEAGRLNYREREIIIISKWQVADTGQHCDGSVSWHLACQWSSARKKTPHVIPLIPETSSRVRVRMSYSSLDLSTPRFAWLGAARWRTHIMQYSKWNLCARDFVIFFIFIINFSADVLPVIPFRCAFIALCCRCLLCSIIITRLVFFICSISFWVASAPTMPANRLNSTKAATFSSIECIQFVPTTKNGNQFLNDDMKPDRLGLTECRNCTEIWKYFILLRIIWILLCGRVCGWGCANGCAVSSGASAEVEEESTHRAYLIKSPHQKSSKIEWQRARAHYYS